jgi:predicted nucleic-acid-binding protein
MPTAPVAQVNEGQIPVIRDEPLNHEEGEQNPQIFLVNRNQNADEVVRNVQNDQFAGQNNLTNLVETILTQKGLNVGSRTPNFVSALSEYVLQT